MAAAGLTKGSQLYLSQQGEERGGFLDFSWFDCFQLIRQILFFSYNYVKLQWARKCCAYGCPLICLSSSPWGSFGCGGRRVDIHWFKEYNPTVLELVLWSLLSIIILVRKWGGAGLSIAPRQSELLLKDEMLWSANYVAAIKKLGLMHLSFQYIDQQPFALKCYILRPVFNWLPSSPFFKAGPCQSHQLWLWSSLEKGEKKQRPKVKGFQPHMF